MVSKKVKWGLLGTGFISEIMANAFSDSTTSTIFGVASQSLEKAKNFAEKFSIQNYYDDHDALMNNPEIDVIYISLPNHLHKEWIIRAATAGKHILCEKPLVLNTQEADEILSAVRQAKVLCMEGLMYRSHPVAHQLESLIQSKVIGDIKLFNAIYTADISHIANPLFGGSIRNLACYPISLVRLLTNAEPVSVLGLGRMNPKTGTDHQATAILKFPNDIIANISTADDLDMSWKFEIYGTKGRISVPTNPWWPEKTNNQILVYPNGEKYPQEINVSADKSLFTYQIDELAQHINRGETSVPPSAVSLEHSYGNINVLEKCLAQIEFAITD